VGRSRNSDPAYHPGTNTPLTLPSAVVVQLRNLVVFRGQNASRLTIIFETPSSAADLVRVAREAHELAVLHSEFADAQRITRLTIGVCRTPVCLELREPPTEIFHFMRAPDRSWAADDGGVR
jgi:hypothetical protein